MNNFKNNSGTDNEGRSVKKALAECFGKSDFGTPAMIKCKSDDAWRDKLENAGIDYAYIDARSISYYALKGIARRPNGEREYYEPEWLKKLKQCGVLVLNNLDAVPEHECGETLESLFGEIMPIRDDFDFLLRGTNADEEDRAVHEGLYFPDNAVTLLINKRDNFDIFFLLRFAVSIDLTRL